jgi:hypothetical protein
MYDMQDITGFNMFFKNAHVRAIRNLTVLLSEMYANYNEGEKPTLGVLRDMLTRFENVIPYVERMKQDEVKRVKWNSVISYFETCFYPPPTDQSGKPIYGGTIGSQRRKTEEVMLGLINQLDNYIMGDKIMELITHNKETLEFDKLSAKQGIEAVSLQDILLNSTYQPNGISELFFHALDKAPIKS